MKSTGQEDMRFYKKHIWVDALANGTDQAVIAFKLANLGGKSVSVELIDVKGSEMDWSRVYYHVVNKTSESTLLYSDLSFFAWGSLSGSSVLIDSYNYTRSTGNVFIASGKTIVTASPISASVEATSEPMKLPPSTSACLASPAISRIPSASSTVRIVNTPGRSAPGIGSRLARPPVASSIFS